MRTSRLMASNLTKKTRLTKETREAIAKYVEHNYSLSAAAQACGVAKSTANEWYHKGENEEEGRRHRLFYDEVNQAHDRATQRLIDRAYELAEKGDIIQKKRSTFHPDGTRTDTTEIQKADDFAVVRWLLEKRHGYDSAPEKAMEKAINRILTISRKYLSEDSFNNLVSAIADDPVLGNVDFDKDLLL